MKRDFSPLVLNYDGRAIVRPMYKWDEETGLPITKNGEQEFSHFEKMTLRLYALDALAGRWKGEEAMLPEEMWKRMKLHDKIALSPDGVVDVNGEECKMILDALYKQGRDPIVFGRMKDMLDSDPKLSVAGSST